MDKERWSWKLRYYYLKYFQKNEKSLWMYRSVRHIGKQRRLNEDVPQYMTKVVNPTAGIGDQLASWITGYFYADFFGLDYASSPLYPEDWEDFLGFAEGVIAAETLLLEKDYHKVRLPEFEHKKDREVSFIKKIIQSYHGQKVIYYIENSHVYGEQYGVKEQLKQKFNAASARLGEDLIYEDGYLNLAVHVRRGDITIGQVNQTPELVMRWLDNSYYVKVLKQLLKIIGDAAKVRIYLFSQGEPQDFIEFCELPNIRYCLDMGAKASFLHMVRADILLTSKSSFSYKPALLSKGLKVCPKHFWHAYPDEADWVTVDEMSVEMDCETMEKIRQFLNRRSPKDES